MNGPGMERRTLQIRGNAVRKTAAISKPRRLPRGQDEHPGFAGPQRGDLQRAVSQSLILREYNPTTLADCPQPDSVLLVTREVIVVHLD